MPPATSPPPPSIALAVTDLDDTAPLITPNQSFSYSENQAANSPVATVLAADAVGVVSFRFSATGTSTSADGFFSIDNAGVITITAAGVAAGVAQNDFETSPNSFSYDLQALDAAGNVSAATSIALAVTDLDDTAPLITPNQSFSYSENQAANSPVATVLAADAVGVVSFRFSATGTSTSADGFFSIDNAGVITITAAGVAAGVAQNDFETSPNSFSYDLQALDAAGNVSAATAIALAVTDLDDTAPLITPNQSFSYSENQAANSPVATVLAADAVGVVSFRFSATGTSTSADGFFSIDNAGVITITAAGVAAGVAQNDFETSPNSFSYDLQALDAAGNVSAATAIALAVTDLDDTAPLITPNQSFSYSENQAANSPVATVLAADAVGVVSFRFSATGTSTSADGFFSIDNAGVITITAAGVAAGVAQNDFETSPNSFSYDLQALDAAGNVSAPVAIALAVTDLDDTAPLITPNQSFSYSENQAANSPVATVLAADAVGVVSFRFSATGTSTSADGFFSIDNAGVITITAAGVAAGVAQNDFETSPNSFSYDLQALDAAGNVSAATAIALAVTDLDDTAPLITPNQSFSYSENQAANSPVATVLAADAVGVVSFRFSATGTSTSADGFFSIDNAGVITITAAGVAAGVAQNDFETSPNSFSYDLQALDAAGNVSAATAIALAVTDLDDTAPLITPNQSFSYSENQAANSPVATVLAADAVGVVSFRFSATGTSTSADGFFSIDNAGVITITAAGVAAGVAQNDFETSPNSFSYDLQALDAAGNVSAATAIALAVTDVNDPPVAGNDLSTTAINVPVVINVLANDSDVDSPSLTITQINGTPITVGGSVAVSNGSVTLNAGGTLTFTPALNYSGSTSFTYLVSDGGGGTATGSVGVAVGVNTPPTGTDATRTIAEDTSYTLLLADFGFTDIDAGQSLANVRIDTLPAPGTLLLNGSPISAGAVVSAADITGGRLVFTPAPNGNGSPYANVRFSVQDSAGAFDPAPNTLTLNVTPVNDDFTDTSEVISINEDSGVTSGNLLTGTSSPDGPVSISGFSIAGQSGPFVLGTPTTISGVGVLTIAANGSYSFTPAANYNGTVPQISYTVTDGLGPSVNSTLSITVAPVNDAPVNTVPAAQNVNEDTALLFSGANTISVNDVDGNLATTRLSVNNGTLSVSLGGGAVISSGANGSSSLTLSGSQAQINAALASLSYQGNLNFNGSDTLTVLSSDSATTPLSDSDTVAITVNAVNDPPVAGNDVIGSIGGSRPAAGTVATIKVTDNDTDPEGTLDPSTITIAGTSAARSVPRRQRGGHLERQPRHR